MAEQAGKGREARRRAGQGQGVRQRPGEGVGRNGGRGRNTPGADRAPDRAPIAPLSRPYRAPHCSVVTALLPPSALLSRPRSRPHSAVIAPLSRRHDAPIMPLMSGYLQ